MGSFYSPRWCSFSHSSAGSAFSKGPDRASINLETNAIRQDTQHAMQKGGELLHQAADKVDAEANRQPAETQVKHETTTVTR